MRKTPVWMRRLVVGGLSAATVAGTGAGLAALAGPASATATFSTTRLGGANRFATAALIATSTFKTANTVIIASGVPGHLPDSLASSYLAGQENAGAGAPILLVNTDSVPSETSQALTTLGAKHCVIVGGTAAVTDAVATTLNGAGCTTSRVSGADRFATAEAVDSQTGMTKIGTGSGASAAKKFAIVAGGPDANLVDSLGASPISFADSFPLLLVNGSTGTLSSTELGILKTDGITDVIIVGGTASVGSQVDTQLTGYTVHREAGSGRSATSQALADFGISNLGLVDTHFNVASGDQGHLVDSLSGGPHGGSEKAPTLITNSSTDAGNVTAFATAHAGTEASAHIFGGTAAVADSTVAAITAAAKTVSSNQTFTVSPAAAQNVNTSTTTQFTVSGLGTSPVDIQLFSCANVSNSSGAVTFPNSSNPGGTGNVATPGTLANGETITVVNGAPVTPTAADNGVTPTSGAVSFTVTNPATAGDCYVPVVFQQGTGANPNLLPLGTNNQPTVPFGVGGATTVISPAAAGTIGTSATSPTLAVSRVSSTGITTASGTYAYKSTDTYQLEVNGTCATSTYSAFQAALTMGDTLGGVYNPTGTSTFCLGDVAPAAPATVTAAANATNGGATVSFTQPAATETADGITGYNIYVAPATAPATTGLPYTCPTSTSVALGSSPQTPPASPYKVLTTVKATGAGTYTYNDTTSLPGASTTAPNAYCYAVSSVATSAAGTPQVGSARPANSTAPLPPGTTTATATATAPAPELPAAAPTTSGVAFSSATATASTVTVTYNQAINPGTVDLNGSDFTVAYTVSGITSQDAVTAATQTTPTVTLTVTSPIPSGAQVVVTSVTGSDGNTVCASGSTTTCQAPGNPIGTTAT